MHIHTQVKCSKVKCTLIQALRLCTDRTAHRGSRDIALLFLEHSTRRGWGVSVTPRSLPPVKTRYPLYRRLGGPQGWSGQVRKISPPTGTRSPDRPARSQSLYRLSYPAHIHKVVKPKSDLYNPLKCDRPQRDRLAACIIAQQYSSDTFFLLPFQFHQE